MKLRERIGVQWRGDFAILVRGGIELRSIRGEFHRGVRISGAVVCLLIAGASLAGQINRRDRLTEPSPELRRSVPAAAAKYKIPGIAAALIDHGQVRDVVVFGVRDKKSSAPMTENTVFEAASLSKPVFAYAVLRLAADGKFNLGVPLTKYLPMPYKRELNPFQPESMLKTDFIDDPRLNQITAMRVMNHTSGMPNWVRDQHMRLLFSPGDGWSYSSEAYVYLQRAVEKATGQPLDALAEEFVLGPFGMGHSSFVWRAEYTPILATGYDREGKAVAATRYLRPVAASTLYTTLDDYARFVGGILASSERQRSHEYAVSLMLQPTVEVDKTLGLWWGEGWGLENLGGEQYFFHWGANPGFQNFVMASRKSGKGVVIFTNSGNGLEAAREVVEATLGGEHPVFKFRLLHPND